MDMMLSQGHSSEQSPHPVKRRRLAKRKRLGQAARAALLLMAWLGGSGCSDDSGGRGDASLHGERGTLDQHPPASETMTADQGDDQKLPGEDLSPSPDQKTDHPGSTVDAPPVGYTGTFSSAAGYQVAELTLGGVARQMDIFVPSNLGANRPLVLAFHGTDSNGWDALTESKADKLAQSEKFLVVAPTARAMTKGDWDNHVAGQVFYETYPNIERATNPDLQLVQAIITEAKRVFGIDRQRVYTMGFSNGAFFSMFAAMRLHEQIAAFAENAGGLVTCPTMGDCSFYSDTVATCAEMAQLPGYCSCSGAEKPGPVATAGYKPPGLLMHAKDDSTVSVYYTCSLSARMTALGYQLQTTIRDGGGHTWPNNFASTAWPFLSQFSHP
jgi:poly(3-hydroxybutyrate) depolymerase